MQREKGAMMILVLITVLLLSMITIGGLTLSTSDLQITQNYYLDRTAYYSAVSGINRGIVEISESQDPSNTVIIEHPNPNERVSIFYYSGKIEDYNSGSPSAQNIGIFTAINPPPPVGISIDSNVQPVIWDLWITGVTRVGEKIAFTEIETGVYTLLNKGY